MESEWRLNCYRMGLGSAGFTLIAQLLTPIGYWTHIGRRADWPFSMWYVYDLATQGFPEYGWGFDTNWVPVFNPFPHGRLVVPDN